MSDLSFGHKGLRGADNKNGVHLNGSSKRPPPLEGFGRVTITVLEYRGLSN